MHLRERGGKGSMGRKGSVEEEEEVPDELRCKRSDGKHWRCSARAIEGRTRCLKHLHQAKTGNFGVVTKKRMRTSEKKAKPDSNIDTDLPKPPPEQPMEGGGYVASSGGDKASSEGEGGKKKPRLEKSLDALLLRHVLKEKNVASPKLFKGPKNVAPQSKKPGKKSSNGMPVCQMSKKVEELYPNQVEKANHLLFLLSMLLPLVKQLHKEQCEEVELELKLKGEEGSNIQRTKLSAEERLYCDNCNTSILDLYRSCQGCNYDLCLSCVGDIRHDRQPGGEHANSAMENSLEEDEVPRKDSPIWRVNGDGSIPCPPRQRGGCGLTSLTLKRILRNNWISRLIANSNLVMNCHSYVQDDTPGSCSLCTRNGNMDLSDRPNDGLYCPLAQDINEESLQHFQWHWRRGEPVVVRNVFHATEGLSWEPMAIWSSIRETRSSKLEDFVKAVDCLDWCEVEISLQQFFQGYQEGRMYRDGWPELLKLKDWPPPEFFEEKVPYHGAEFLRSLPFHEYTHPSLGILNLASWLPPNISRPDLGLKTYIAYGYRDELGRGDSITKLHCDKSDVVNVLTHAAEVKIPTWRRRILEKARHEYLQEISHCEKHEYLKLESQTDKESFVDAREATSDVPHELENSVAEASTQDVDTDKKEAASLHPLSVPQDKMECNGAHDKEDKQCDVIQGLEKGVKEEAVGPLLHHVAADVPEDVGRESVINIAPNLDDGVKESLALPSCDALEDSKGTAARTDVKIESSKNVRGEMEKSEINAKGDHDESKDSSVDHAEDSAISRMSNVDGESVPMKQSNVLKEPSKEDTIKDLDLAYGGASWDIFRREDAPKLQAFLKAHSKEFKHLKEQSLESVTHPIHDQTFFLNERHKKILKEEYGIEPWTLQQHVGDAVFVPAGCPHQVRNLKSCIKVALDFVSVESVEYCLNLTKEFRLLPQNHIAKEDKLEVRKMILYATSSVMKELRCMLPTES